MKIEITVPDYGQTVYIIDMKWSQTKCKTCGYYDSTGKHVVKNAYIRGYVAQSERKRGIVDDVRLICQVRGNVGTGHYKRSDVFTDRESANKEAKRRNEEAAK